MKEVGVKYLNPEGAL